MTEPNKIELKLDGQWLDVSGFVKDVTLDHPVPSEHEQTWGEAMAGLKQASFTVGGVFDGDIGAYFPPPKPRYRVTREIPDGRWQTLKWRLKQFRLLSWLKVRYRTYSFDAVVESWDQAGLSMRGDGPVSRSTEEKR